MVCLWTTTCLKVNMRGDGYISPSILEERQLNVTQMDVFPFNDGRIIFLGSEINDYVANVIQAQLLFLDTSDPGKDISIYLKAPQVGLCRTWHLRHYAIHWQ